LCGFAFPLLLFLSDFAPHRLPPFSSFNDDFDKTKLTKDGGVKSLKKKRGCKIAQLAKDMGKKCN